MPVVVAGGYVFLFCVLIWLAVRGLRQARPGAEQKSLLAIWLLPLLLLFVPNAIIRGDYIGHLGHIILAAGQIGDGDLLPNVVHSYQLIGDPAISVAGRFLYLSTAYLSLGLGPNVALRIILLAATALQVAITYRCATAYCRGNTALAVTVTALAYWSTYAMNNLYIRGAVAEFFATSLICSAVALTMLWWLQPGKWWTAIAVVLTYSAGALTHPITAVYGGVFLLVMAVGLATAYGVSARHLRLGVLMIASTLLIMSPWLYLMWLYPPAGSTIGQAFHFIRFEGLDELWLRLLPFPLSRLPESHGHPAFVTQINVLFLPLGAALLWTCRAGVPSRRPLLAAALMLTVAGLLLTVSVSDVFDALIPQQLMLGQFSYRLVTYINLAMLAALLLAANGTLTGSAPGPLFDRRSRWYAVLPVFVGISAIGVVFNLWQMERGIDAPPGKLLSQIFGEPGASYTFARSSPSRVARLSYSMSLGCLYARTPRPDDVHTDICQTRGADVRVLPARQEPFTAVIPARLQGKEWITTNVVYHPWNRLSVDGRPVETGYYHWFYEIRIREARGPAGEAPTVQYELRIDPEYLMLDRMSIALMLGLSGLLVVRRLASPAARRPQPSHARAELDPAAADSRP